MDIVVKMDRFQILQNVINVKYTLGDETYETNCTRIILCCELGLLYMSEKSRATLLFIIANTSTNII